MPHLHGECNQQIDRIHVLLLFAAYHLALVLVGGAHIQVVLRLKVAAPTGGRTQPWPRQGLAFCDAYHRVKKEQAVRVSHRVTFQTPSCRALQ